MNESHAPAVFVVEDNADLRDSLRELLEIESFRCRTAASADEALHALETTGEVPDVFLLDLVMPGMPTVEFVEKLRGRHDCERTRIVFMTGLSRYHLPRSVSVEAVVRKPFTPEELFQTLRAVL